MQRVRIFLPVKTCFILHLQIQFRKCKGTLKHLFLKEIKFCSRHSLFNIICLRWGTIEKCLIVLPFFCSQTSNDGQPNETANFFFQKLSKQKNSFLPFDPTFELEETLNEIWSQRRNWCYSFLMSTQRLYFLNY
jgi:hypothetical protein